MNNVPIIDCHTSVTPDGKWFNTGYDASIDELLRQMDEARIEKSVVLPLYPLSTNEFMNKMVMHYSDRIIGFGCLRLKSWRDDVKKIKDFGLKGIKLHPRQQRTTVKDLDEIGILDELALSRLPLMVCGWTQSHEVPIRTISPLIIDETAKKYPDVTFIISHMGGHFFWDAFFCARSNNNVYVDCSYFLSFFLGTSLENDFWKIAHKIDHKLLYGSDFPEISLVDYFRCFDEKLAHTNIRKEAVYHDNLQKLLNNSISS